MHRTGAALTLEARESKGQSWLGTRESSTSLVRLDADDSDDSDDNNTAGEHHHPASMSPMWVRGVEHDYMDAGLLHAAAAGILRTSDTVDKDSSSDEDDDEVDFRGGVFGIGQFIDRVIGWSVFADEETESEGEGEAGEERKKKRERIRLAPMEEEKLAEVRERREQDEGWQDPAWIFSVASSILF